MQPTNRLWPTGWELLGAQIPTPQVPVCFCALVIYDHDSFLLLHKPSDWIASLHAITLYLRNVIQWYPLSMERNWHLMTVYWLFNPSSFLRILFQFLLCCCCLVPLRLTWIICVTTILEQFLGIMWAFQWLHNYK